MITPTANIFSNERLNEHFSSKIRNKIRMPTFAISFNTILEVIARAIRQEKLKMSKLKLRKLCLFTDDRILYRENPKESLKTY